MIVCVTSIRLRRSKASAATPLIIENRMTGKMRTSPTRPSAMARWSGGTSIDTCHSTAADCMKVPENDTSRPIQSRRKLRWWSAMNIESQYSV